MAEVTYQDHDIYEMHIKEINDGNANILVDNIKDISATPSETPLEYPEGMIILTDDVKIIDTDGKTISFKDLKQGDILKGEFKPPIIMLMSYPGQIGASSITRLIRQ